MNTPSAKDIKSLIRNNIKYIIESKISIGQFLMDHTDADFHTIKKYDNAYPLTKENISLLNNCRIFDGIRSYQVKDLVSVTVVTDDFIIVEYSNHISAILRDNKYINMKMRTTKEVLSLFVNSRNLSLYRCCNKELIDKMKSLL